MPTPDFTPSQLAAARKLLPDWEAFCPYETAAKMKELGYDEPSPFVFFASGIPDEYGILPHVERLNCDDTDDVRNSTVDEELNGDPLLRTYCTAPTLAQAARWLRETHKLHPSADTYADGKWINEVNGLATEAYMVDTYPTYEAALLAAIDRALDIVQQRQAKHQ